MFGNIAPHKIQYYLERRDPEFDAKMVQVLHVYKEVEIWRQKGVPPPDSVAVLSYDEKPGIQAIENTATDLPPAPGKHSAVGRDHEYIRHGTLSLLAGIDLLSGEVLGLVRKRHRSAEFIEFLKLADAHYPAGARIRIVLDNHSAILPRPLLFRENVKALLVAPRRSDGIIVKRWGAIGALQTHAVACMLSAG